MHAVVAAALLVKTAALSMGSGSAVRRPFETSTCCKHNSNGNSNSSDNSSSSSNKKKDLRSVHVSRPLRVRP